MSTALKAIKNLKQIAREEFILPRASLCGGCRGLEALRLEANVLGPRTVFVNAAGCFTLLATFLYTPFKGSWLYTTMASAAAGAQGVRDALNGLMAHSKIAPDDVEEAYLQGHGGYRHLFEPTRNAGALGQIQAQADLYWSKAVETTDPGRW